MNKAFIVQVTVYDMDSKKIMEQIIEHYDGSYGFEVERIFEDLGKDLATVIDPGHGK